jgi:pyrroloquinoline-quinone synthase
MMNEQMKQGTSAADRDGKALGVELVAKIKRMVVESNINNNAFYNTFGSRKLPPNVLKKVFQNYYYYIRTFPKILAGLTGRVENETVRMKLARTVVSELGDNGEGKAHYLMFEDVLSAVGIKLDDWQSAKHIPEAEELVEGLRNLFLVKPCNHALGAHYVIEEFGFPMIVALYEGFRQYDNWTHESFAYFYLHLLIESNHVDWISDAVMAAADGEQSASEVEQGAREVLTLLASFWAGLNRLAID